MDELCRAYWLPLYTYLRRKGVDRHNAADLVQGLFADLIAKGRLVQVDRDKGRFRTWLLSALKYHESHERERRTAAKRGGDLEAFALDPDDADRRWQLTSNRDLDPERLFDRVWALQVLARALERVGGRHRTDRDRALFGALSSMLVARQRVSSYGEVGRRLGLSEAAVKAAAHRLRRDFKEAVHIEVSATVCDPADIADEVRALFSALAP